MIGPVSLCRAARPQVHRLGPTARLSREDLFVHRLRALLVPLLALLVAFPAPLANAQSMSLNGAGATFPAPLYGKWFDVYAGKTGVEVNYQAIGSGGGIKAITDKTVDFGASDGPMTEEQMQAAGGPNAILHIPMTLGAVVPIYNIPELQEQGLRFSGETLAGIFLGDIAKWDDAKIKADNPNVNLPSKDIIVVHRADGSGTTFIFTDYLSVVSPE